MKLPIPTKAKTMVWAHCAKCGMGRSIAYGYNADALTRTQFVEALNRLGFQAAPKILCPKCASNLTTEDILKLNTLWNLIDSNHNRDREITKFHMKVEELAKFYDCKVEKYLPFLLRDEKGKLNYGVEK